MDNNNSLPEELEQRLAFAQDDNPKFNITLHEEDAADMIDMFSGPPPGEMGFEDFTRTARQASRGALTR